MKWKKKLPNYSGKFCCSSVPNLFEIINQITSRIMKLISNVKNIQTMPLM